jgi:hypothetical protein
MVPEAQQLHTLTRAVQVLRRLLSALPPFLALAISFYVAWYQFIRVKHSLTASVLTLSYEDGALLADVALINDGNRWEALRAAGFAYGQPVPGPRPGEFIDRGPRVFYFEPGDLPAPVVLRPGVTKIIRLMKRVSPEEIAALGSQEKDVRRTPVFVDFSALRPDGYTEPTHLRCGSVAFLGNGSVVAEWDSKGTGASLLPD